MPITKSCIICFKEFKTKPCWIDRAKYCSSECQHEGLKLYYKSRRPKMNCEICKKEFTYNKHTCPNRQFCSLKCKGIGSRIVFNGSEFDLNILKEKLENSYIINSNGCYVWNKVKMSNGYGILNYGRKKKILAHRAAWLVNNGPIPQGLFVLHKCDFPSCINYKDHLFLGTAKENSVDCSNKGRTTQGEKSASAKLNNQEVIEIKKLLNSGIHYAELAKKHNVSPRTINDIKNNKTWKHIQV